MAQDQNNILSGLSLEEKREFRKMFIDAILLTDMASHFTFVNKFKQRFSFFPLPSPSRCLSQFFFFLECN